VNTRLIIFLSLIFFQSIAARQAASSKLLQTLKKDGARAAAFLKRFKNYSKETGLFYYHGLITKKCSKKQRKKAKKNFRWYRNWAILFAFAAGAKWKTDQIKKEVIKGAKQKVDSLVEELPDKLINRLDNPSKKQQDVEAAFKRKVKKIVRENVEEIKQDGWKKMEEIMEPACTKTGDTFEHVGKLTFSWFERPVRWLMGRPPGFKNKQI